MARCYHLRFRKKTVLGKKYLETLGRNCVSTLKFVGGTILDFFSLFVLIPMVLEVEKSDGVLCMNLSTGIGS